MKKAYVLVTLLACVAMFLAACGPAATTAPAPVVTQPPATEPPTAVPPTEVPTEVPTAVPPTPTAAPTAVPPVCAKLSDAPTAAAGALGSADNPIVITFVPSGDTGKITKAGTAIADCLGQMTGLSFKMEVGTTFAASIEAMGAEKAQVSFLNTFSVL